MGTRAFGAVGFGGGEAGQWKARNRRGGKTGDEGSGVAQEARAAETSVAVRMAIGAGCAATDYFPFEAPLPQRHSR